MVRAWCLQLGLGLEPGNGIISAFFYLLLCSSDEDLCDALLARYSMTFTMYVRTTVRDVMMMYSKEQYMENLPMVSTHT